MGVVCIAELIYECCGVFLFAEGTFGYCVWPDGYICNAWFVYCASIHGSFYLSTISDHLAIKQQCNHIHSPFIQPVISLLYVHTPFWFSTRGVSLPISCIAHGS